jgi:hypothetical protein
MFDIYQCNINFKINHKNSNKMGCGCKNKGQQAQPVSQPNTQGAQQPQQPNNSIQESIKKVVEKYYKK